METDRLLTLYLFHPLLNKAGERACASIPILMYHRVSDEDESNVHPYYRLSTSPAIFAAQMRYLKAHDYTTLSLDDALRFLSSPPPDKLSGKYVVITFDDGYMDFYTHAFPVLEECGFTATVFLPTDSIGGKGGVKGREHLGWEQVMEAHRRGIIFGSHTVTHPELDSLGAAEVEYELKHSKAVIEDHIGAPVASFSYPFAFPEGNRPFTEQLRNLLVESGYKNGVSTKIGTVNAFKDRYFLSRLPVNSRDDEVFFRAKLEGGYDWLHRFQYLFKLSKRLMHRK